MIFEFEQRDIDKIAEKVAAIILANLPDPEVDKVEAVKGKQFCTIKEGAQLLGIGRNKMYSLIQQGVVKKYDLGGMPVLNIAELLSAPQVEGDEKRGASRGEKKKRP